MITTSWSRDSHEVGLPFVRFVLFVVNMHSIAASRSRHRPSSHRFAVRSRATPIEPISENYTSRLEVRIRAVGREAGTGALYVLVCWFAGLNVRMGVAGTQAPEQTDEGNGMNATAVVLEGRVSLTERSR